MSARLKTLYEEQAKLVKQNQDLLDQAEKEGRKLSAAESENWDKADERISDIVEEVQRRERMAKLDASLKESSGRKIDPADPADEPVRKAEPAKLAEWRLKLTGATRQIPLAGRTASPEYNAAFGNYLRNGISGFTPRDMSALQADLDASGGTLVAPQQFVANLIKAVDDAVFVRSLATVYQVSSADSLGAPTLDADPADADWTGEITSVSEDTTMATGKRTLTPHPLTKLIKVSQKLLRTAAIGAEQLVTSRLGYKFGITEEKGFLTGTGANQPLGVFIANSSGISTSRDVSTDNTSSAITADGLINALFSLKDGYMRNASWIFHRDAMKQIRKLKDTAGQYIYAAGGFGAEHEQNRVGALLLGRPVYMSEYAPNTFTTGLYVGIVGDFSYYWIAESLSMQVQRLVELYAANNQVGFIGRMELDGMPVLGEAFARVKLA